MQIRVFDAPTTKRGIVRVHNGAITDLAFASISGQTLLAASSADGRISVSHVVPPLATDVASDLAVHVVFCLQLEGDFMGVASAAPHGWRPLVVWHPEKAEFLVATRTSLLRINTLTVVQRQRRLGMECEGIAPDRLPEGTQGREALSVHERTDLTCKNESEFYNSKS
jgi:hypothetical protein